MASQKPGHRRGGAGQDAIFKALRLGIKFKPDRAQKQKRQQPVELPFHSHSHHAAVAAIAKSAPTAAAQAEALNALRNKRKIRVVGDAPAILLDKEALGAAGVPTVVLDNMTTLGWDSLSDTQMQSIPIMLGERDVLSCAPTGSGKTGAFVIPIISRLLQRVQPQEFVTVLPPTATGKGNKGKHQLGIHFDELWPVVNEVDPEMLGAKVGGLKLRRGCILLAINGRRVADLNFADAVPMIQTRPATLLWRRAPDDPLAATAAPPPAGAARPSTIRAVILAPTRELAAQIARETVRLAAHTGLVTTHA